MPGAFAGRTRRSLARIGLAALAALLVAAAGDVATARKKHPPLEAAPAASLLPKDLFGAAETPHPPATDFAKWTETLARYEKERGEERALCEQGDCALVRWREFLATLARKDPLAQLRAVNDYLNRVPYRTDLENYGVEDYWATPKELFAKGGDCEDYAIAKYLSLRALGWPAERLRVVVIHDNARDLVHAALVAYHEGNAYLLDIEIATVTDHRNVSRYVPIFAISETGWWSYKPLPPVQVVKALANIGAVEKSPWRSLFMRHKPGHARAAAPPPPRLSQPPVAHHARLGRPLHMKHKAALRTGRAVAKAPAPAEGTAAKRPPGVEIEPATASEPGERIEELFLPAAQ